MGCRLIVVVMGVSGAGKSTVGRALADALGIRFVEGDAYHPPENVAKMARGEPLDEADRGPWLDRLAGEINRWRRDGVDAVLACSALRRRYRVKLAGEGEGVRFVHLQADAEVIRARLERRAGHYMPPGLLGSQLETLEAPDGEPGVLTVGVEQPVAAVVRQIGAWLAGPPSP